MSTKISSKPIPKYPPELKTYISLCIYYSMVVIFKILISIPFALFRFLVIVYVKKFARDRKEYGDIFSSVDTLLTDDHFTTCTTNFSIVTVLELEGKLTLDKLRFVMKRTIEMKTEGSSQDRYTKLVQYPQSVMGYWFWKNEANFNLDEHLNTAQFNNLVSDSTLDMKTVTKLHGQFLNKTFPEHKSPWYITLIENVPQATNQECPKTLLVLKIHHSLADGISVLKLLVEGLGQSKVNTSESSRPVSTPLSIFDRLQYYLKVVVYLFPKMVESALYSHIFQQITLNHPWRHSSSLDQNIQSFPQFSKEIPVEMLKLKFDQSSSSVSPSAVIITAITESIRKFWKNNQQNCENIFLMSSLPKPMHPSFPTNHVNFGAVTMPNFGENVNQALQHSNSSYISQRDDDIHHLSNQISTNLLTVLPKSIRLATQPFWPFVTVSSNVAGNNVEFSIDDLPCKDFSLSATPANSSIGVVFTIFSYKKLVRFCVMAKENVLTKEESQHLADLVVQQINKMNENATTPRKAG